MGLGYKRYRLKLSGPRDLPASCSGCGIHIHAGKACVQRHRLEPGGRTLLQRFVGSLECDHLHVGRQANACNSVVVATLRPQRCRDHAIVSTARPKWSGRLKRGSQICRYAFLWQDAQMSCSRRILGERDSWLQATLESTSCWDNCSTQGTLDGERRRSWTLQYPCRSLPNPNEASPQDVWMQTGKGGGGYSTTGHSVTLSPSTERPWSRTPTTATRSWSNTTSVQDRAPRPTRSLSSGTDRRRPRGWPAALLRLID